MARPWTEVIADPNFQALAPEAQEQARNAYFQQNVLPNIPKDANAGAIRLQFDQQTKPTVADQAQATQSPGFMDQLGRQTGLAGRAVINGLTGIPQMAADAGVAARNLVTGNVDTTNLKTLLLGSEKAAREGATPSFSGQFNQALTDAGLPEPQTRNEKIAGLVESALAGSRVPAPEISQQAPAGFRPPLTQQQQTLQSSQQAGYVVPPSSVKPTVTNMLLESAGGKAATAQAAAIRNQQVTNELAATSLGLPKNTTITPDILKGLRADAGKVYQQVSSTGRIQADSQYATDLAKIEKPAEEIAADFPDASVAASAKITDLIKSLSRDSFDAKSGMAYMRMLRQQGSANINAAKIAGGDPEKMALGTAQRDAAGALEDMVIRHLSAQGKDDLAESFDQARTLIAKTHSVEDALNPATGNIVAKDLAKQLSKNKPLTGTLRTAADFATAFPKAAAEIKDSGPVSAVDAILGGGGALASHTIAPLALPLVRMGARYGLLSPAVQSKLLPGTAEGIPSAYLMGGMAGLASGQ